jgi:uncharacterized protein YegJ (DUF2314 family)
MSNSPVFFFDNDDPEMQRAYEQARATFRYFWRELSWEQRRIVPGLDVACVKAPFTDGDPNTPSRSDQFEQMWVSDVNFDGRIVSGTLINSPNWLRSVKEGDHVRLPTVTDWMYAIQGRVYGAFTVNLMRSRMDRRERAEHDAAWGLDFGDPRSIEVIPLAVKGRPADLNADHPMAINMRQSLAEHLQQDPRRVHERDDEGWTLLHRMSLAGSPASVEVLLNFGADPNAVTNHGLKPLQLAKSLGWNQVMQLLASRGAS